MAEFDINKVITIKDYLINPNCIEVGKRYYYGDNIFELEDRVLNDDRRFSGDIEEIQHDKCLFGYFIIKDRTRVYIYPYIEPEKKFRPFKGEEILSVLGRMVIEKVSDSYIKILSLITSVALKDEDACIRVDSLWLSAEEFLDKYNFYNDNGTTSPCGVKEEEA